MYSEHARKGLLTRASRRISPRDIAEDKTRFVLIPGLDRNLSLGP
jgi:hypothetical protein